MRDERAATPGVASVALSEAHPARPRLDHSLLVSNLASGALCLTPLLFPPSPLFLVGAAYIAVGSVFLAAAYAREVLTRGQESLVWIAPWLAAVALWAWIGTGIGPPDASGLLTLWFGLWVATPCFLVWQVVALAIRQIMARWTPKSD